MDGEQLDVADGSFSAVLCGFGIFFMPDPDRAAAGFHRALAPGGTVAISTWGAEDDRWSWEDDLFADVVVPRRALQRPFDRRTTSARCSAAPASTTSWFDAEHHEVRLADADEWWAWKWSYSLRGVLEQLSTGTTRPRAP